MTGGDQVAAQGVEDLGAHPDGLGEGGRADGRDHELLEVERIVGVRTAIDDVHHRHRQQPGVDAADVAVQGETVGGSGRLGGGQRDAEQGIGAEPRLGLRTVEFDHRAVHGRLALGVQPDHRVRDALVDGVDGAANSLAVEAGWVSVAEFDRLPGAG